jgi:hypothetical protein
LSTSATLRECVGFLYYEATDGTKGASGTAFWLGVPSVVPKGGVHTYLVTAAHVLDDIESEGATDRVYLRMNTPGGDAAFGESGLRDWHRHPDPTVDVAVLPARWGAGSVAAHWWLASDAVTPETIARHEIGAGDDVFMMGLFSEHYGEQKNIPIVRVGNIAAMPEEPVATSLGQIEAYLVEARSTGGLSGSPVFVHFGWSRFLHGQLKTAKGDNPFLLLGLVHGHYDERPDGLKRVNMGIGIVVPATRILEVIDGPILRPDREAWEKAVADMGYTPEGDGPADRTS